MQSLREETTVSDSLRKTDSDLSKISLKNAKKVVNRIYHQCYILKKMVPRYSEFELNEFVEASPNYLREMTETDFIQKLCEIPEPLPENCVLFCFEYRNFIF